MIDRWVDCKTSLNQGLTNIQQKPSGEAEAAGWSLQWSVSPVKLPSKRTNDVRMVTPGNQTLAASNRNQLGQGGNQLEFAIEIFL